MESPSTDQRLESWKEIASYLNRDIRTVQRWEKSEGLPVHRHLHERQSSVHAFKSELDAWRAARAALPASATNVETTASAPYRKWVWPAAGIALLLIVGTIVLRSGNRSGTTQPLKPVPFTTYPGDERNPTFSPGGDQVAFAWNGRQQDNFDIYIKQVGGADEPLRLTSTPAHEISPVWSPDGRNIAFLQVGSSGETKVMIMPALGGGAREVALTRIRRLDDAYGYLTWSRDAEWIVWCHRENMQDPCGLRAVSLQSGEVRQLTEPSGAWDGDQDPVFSPDGRSLLFARMREIGVEDLYSMALDAHLKPLAPPIQLTSLGVAGTATWLPDGGQIVFSAGEYRGIRHLWRVRMGAASPLKAERIAEVGEDAVNVASSSSKGQVRLVYNREILDENVWRVDLSRIKAKPSLVIASTRSDYNPNYSPDGSRVVFVSNRSGSSEIWTCDRDGSRPVMLTSFAGKLTSNPKWSPDGKTIVFDSRIKHQPHLYTINATGGLAKRLTGQPASEATWSRDGKWIYFSSDQGGRPEIWKIPAAGGSPVQVTAEGGVYAIESVDGRFLYYVRAQYPRPVSIWRMPVAGGPSVKILDSLERHLNFAVSGDGIYFAELDAAGTVSLSVYRFARGASERLAPIDKPISFGLTLAPDGAHLLYSQIDQQGSDLMLVENFR